MRSSLLRAAGALALAAFLGSSAYAQSPATTPTPGDFAKDQVQRQGAQPLNNQPVWKEVRSGLPQTTSLPGRETNVLIQSEGQTWRAMRVPIATAGGVLIAAVLLTLMGFYAWRGTITLHGNPTGRLIERFTPVKRMRSEERREGKV